MTNSSAAGGARIIRPSLTPGMRPIFTLGAVVLTAALTLIIAILPILRGGLGDSPAAIFLLWGSALLPIWLSVWALNKHGGTAMGAGIAAASSLLAGLLLPLLGLAIGQFCGWLLLGLLAAVMLLARRELAQAVRIMGLRGAAAIALTALVLLAVLGPQRLFLPETMTLGTASSDSYYHAAIAQMILHYGIPSLGADGLLLHHYHTLSHALAAGLAGSSGAGVPLIYLYWGSLILKAQLVWCFFVCLALWAPRTDWPDATSAYAGLAYAGLSALLVSGLDSESFLLSLTLLSASLPLLLALMSAKDDEPRLSLGLAIACVAALACAGAKVSSGFFMAIGLAVIAWNLRRRLLFPAAVLLTFVLLALLAKLALTPRDLGMGAAPKIVILASYLQYLKAETVFSYVLPLVVIALLVPPSPAGLLRRLFAAENAAKFILLCLLGCVAVLFTSLIGSNMQYFSAILFAIALLLLPAALGRLPASGAWSLAGIATLLLAALMPAIAAAPADGFTTLATLYERTQTGGGHIAIAADIRASLRQTRTPFALLHSRLAATPWSQLLRTLETENARYNDHLAVQIAPDAEDVWSRMKGGSAWWCMAPQAMIPAQTGLYELRSIAPRRIEALCAPPGLVWYGFGIDQEAHRTASLSDVQLCTLARPYGSRAVYRLHSYRDLGRNSVTRCG